MKNPALQEKSLRRLAETRRLYEDEKLSMGEIGKLLGITRQGVQERLKRAGVKRRLRGHGHEAVPDTVLAEMRRLYDEEVLSVEKIADLYSIPAQVARERLVRAGATIKIRPKNRIERETLYDLYVVQQLSYDAVEARLGVSHSVISRELRRHGIKPRPRLKLVMIERELLYKLYVTDGLSQQAVGRELGVSEKIIRREIRRYQIKVEASRWPGQ